MQFEAPSSSVLTRRLGDLVRLLLMQLQKGKVDLETALLALDKLLRANELNFALLTFIPASFVAYAILKGVIGLAWSRDESRKKGAHRMLSALWDIERRCNLAEGSDRARGLLLVSLYRIHKQLDRSLVRLDSPRMQKDLSDLADPKLSDEQRRWTVIRIRSTIKL